MPVEAHNSVGIVERYHGPVRRAYEIIIEELKDQGISRDAALQTAFKAINDSAGPDGLIPTLLVYGAFPRMTEYDPPSPTIAERAVAIKKAMDEVQKQRAKRQIQDALRTRNGPNTTAIHDLELNSDVLVWRDAKAGQKGHWDGPFRLISKEGEDCVIQQGDDRTTFRSTKLKPFYTQNTDNTGGNASEEDTNDKDEDTGEGDDLPETEPNIETVRRSNRTRRLSRKLAEPRRPTELRRLVGVVIPVRKATAGANTADISVFLQDMTCDAYAFETSRSAEVAGLIKKGTFKVVNPASIPNDIRIFKSRFVDEMKNKGGNLFEKSRLVVQAYDDIGKQEVLTQSPTIQRVSQRIILCLTPTMMARNPNIKLFLRDITQAYVQSNTRLESTHLHPSPH